jgi:hypothetical protein
VRQRTVETRDELTAQEAMIPGSLVTGRHTRRSAASSSAAPVQKGREQLPDQWRVSAEQLRSTLVGDGLEGLLDSCLPQALVQVPGSQGTYPGFRMASPRCAGHSVPRVTNAAAEPVRASRG